MFDDVERGRAHFEHGAARLKDTRKTLAVRIGVWRRSSTSVYDERIFLHGEHYSRETAAGRSLAGV
jgi:hypothetical protein